GIVGDPDVLVHADAGDFVVAALERHVVGERDGHPILEAQTRDPGLRVIVLRLRQGHAVGANAIVLRRMAQERAPAAADVEEGLARTQPQLAADQVELVPLRLLERVGPVAEVRARIDHLAVEKQRVEGVADIVVKLNEVLVLAASAAPGRVAAPELVADRRRAVARQYQGQRVAPGEPFAQIGKPDPGFLTAPARRVAERDQIALDLEVALDITAKQVTERGPTEQGAEHARSGNGDAWSARGVAAERDGGADPQPHRDRGIDALREMLEDAARGRGVSLRQPAFP